MLDSRKEDLLKQLYYNNYPIMLRYGLKLVGDRALVLDVIQGLFLKFYEMGLNLEMHPAPDAYVIKSFRRELIKVEKKYYGTENKLQTDSVQYSYEDILIQKENSFEQNTKLVKLLNSLTDRQREIIWLHYFEGKTYSEVAEILDVNYQSILNNLQRSFRKIRNEFPRGVESL